MTRFLVWFPEDKIIELGGACAIRDPPSKDRIVGLGVTHLLQGSPPKRKIISLGDTQQCLSIENIVD